MKTIDYVSTIFIALVLSACSDSYDNELHGTYSINDSLNIRFSKLSFYPHNIYSFSAHSCLSGNSDSGQYRLDKDTITFQSYDLNRVDSFFSPAKMLTGFKFVYRKDKIYCFTQTTFPDNQVQIDTLCWTKNIHLD